MFRVDATCRRQSNICFSLYFFIHSGNLLRLAHPFDSVQSRWFRNLRGIDNYQWIGCLSRRSIWLGCAQCDERKKERKSFFAGTSLSNRIDNGILLKLRFYLLNWKYNAKRITRIPPLGSYRNHHHHFPRLVDWPSTSQRPQPSVWHPTIHRHIRPAMTVWSV